MRPVHARFPVNQSFGSMKTAGVVGNINASQDTVEYYVGRYGNYQPDGHAGCDIACPEGTPVYAMASGTVLWADWGSNLPGDDSWSPSGYFRRWALYKGFPGIVTVIQHDGWIGVYAHLSAAWLNPGDVVSEGMQIGLSGGTGGVDPHLHVEALIDLTYSTGGGLIYGRTDPTKYFGAAAIAPQGTTTKEDSLSAAEVKQIIQAISDARLDVKATVNAVPGRVWAVPVTRGGKRISALQELADAKTSASGLAPAIAEIQANTDPDALADLIPDALAQQVIDALAARLAGGK